MTANTKEFIKNIIDVEVYAARGLNHYTIKAQYNELVTDHIGTHWALTSEIVDEFDYTWEDIEKDGGIAQVNKDMKEAYGVA